MRITGVNRENYSLMIDELNRITWMDSKGNFVERWEQGFRKSLYHGRTGSFYAGEHDKPFEEWTCPPLVEGVNSNQPAPFNNAVHLVNTRDGVTADELYFAPMSVFHVPVVLVVDLKLPAINDVNFPVGAYVTLGFEVNSGGYKGFIVEWFILNGGAGVECRLACQGIVDGVRASVQTSDIKSLIPTGAWKNFILVLLPNRFVLLGDDGSQLASLDLPVDLHGFVIPYFANEFLVVSGVPVGTPIVSGVYVGQFQVYQAVGLKSVRKILDAASIAAGGYVESDVLVLPRECALQVKQTYGASATSGVAVYVLACNRDGSVVDSENSTDAFACFEPSFSAGATRVRTVNLDMLPKYCKVRVRNKDSANAQGACQVFLHEVF